MNGIPNTQDILKRFLNQSLTDRYARYDFIPPGMGPEETQEEGPSTVMYEDPEYQRIKAEIFRQLTAEGPEEQKLNPMADMLFRIGAYLSGTNPMELAQRIAEKNQRMREQQQENLNKLMMQMNILAEERNWQAVQEGKKAEAESRALRDAIAVTGLNLRAQELAGKDPMYGIGKRSEILSGQGINLDETYGAGANLMYMLTGDIPKKEKTLADIEAENKAAKKGDLLGQIEIWQKQGLSNDEIKLKLMGTGSRTLTGDPFEDYLKVSTQIRLYASAINQIDKIESDVVKMKMLEKRDPEAAAKVKERKALLQDGLNYFKKLLDELQKKKDEAKKQGKTGLEQPTLTDESLNDIDTYLDSIYGE